MHEEMMKLLITCLLRFLLTRDRMQVQPGRLEPALRDVLITSAEATVRADCRLRVARLACEASLQSSTAALTSSHLCHSLPWKLPCMPILSMLFSSSRDSRHA